MGVSFYSNCKRGCRDLGVKTGQWIYPVMAICCCRCRLRFSILFHVAITKNHPRRHCIRRLVRRGGHTYCHHCLDYTRAKTRYPSYRRYLPHNFRSVRLKPFLEVRYTLRQQRLNTISLDSPVLDLLTPSNTVRPRVLDFWLRGRRVHCVALYWLPVPPVAIPYEPL